MPCEHWLEWTFIKVMPFLPYSPRWCLLGCVVSNTYLPTIPGLRIPLSQQQCWDRYRQAERHNSTGLFHVEGFTKPCIQRWCGMYPVIGILTEHGKLTFHESWQSTRSTSWVHSPSQHSMCAAWLGIDTSSKIKKTAMPEINTSSPALQKPRFCSGGESASYPLWKSRELTMTDIFSLQCSCKNCIHTSCGNVNPVFCFLQWGSFLQWAKTYQYFQCCWRLCGDTSCGEWFWRSWKQTHLGFAEAHLY